MKFEKEDNMIFFIELHGFKGVTLEINNTQCLISLFFMTFGCVANLTGYETAASPGAVEANPNSNVRAATRELRDNSVA